MALSICPYVRQALATFVRSVVYNSCWQAIVKTMWPRMLKLSVYICMERGRSLYIFKVKGQIFKVIGPLQRILALGSLWAGYSKNYMA